MSIGGFNYIFKNAKSKFNTDIYSKIAFDKTTSISDCELYCDLILDININKLRNIIHKHYNRRDNWNLTKWFGKNKIFLSYEEISRFISGK